MPGATRSIVINAPMDKVFSVIADFDKYGEFLSEVRKVTTSDRKGNEVLVHYEIEVVKTVRYTLKLKTEPPNRISWTFVQGDFMKDNKGHWLLEDAGGGQTKAIYNIEMALGMLVPKTIVTAMVDNQLPKMLEAFKKRIESR
jgi:ribosome-associated toxin RatA of RatAB toxin-antitoxin module